MCNRNDCNFFSAKINDFAKTGKKHIGALKKAKKNTRLTRATKKRSRQDLYSHTHVTIDMTLYRNTQPAHTTALIQGTYYQHEPTITFAIIAHNRESRSKNSRLDSKNDRKTQ